MNPLQWAHEDRFFGRVIDWSLGLTALGWAAGALLGDHGLSVAAFTLAALNLTVGVLFIRRRPPERIAGLGDCVVCLGTVLISGVALKLAPPPSEWPAVAQVAFAVAGAGAVLSLASLGSSFAVLPAARGIVVRGPYRIIRHPAYAFELIMVLACSLTGGTLVSLLPVAAAIPLLVLRIRIEEKLLSRSEEYRRYRQTVRFRLVPGLW